MKRDPLFYEKRKAKMLLIKQKEAKSETSDSKMTYREYEKIVRELTEQQPIGILSNIENRGFFGYHIDHIISIRYGYENGINPSEIADISNLQAIHYKDNITKHHNSYCIIEACGHLCKR